MVGMDGHDGRQEGQALGVPRPMWRNLVKLARPHQWATAALVIGRRSNSVKPPRSARLLGIRGTVRPPDNAQLKNALVSAIIRRRSYRS